ncbi:MAG: LysR family transcriptional regulator [Reyranella sp.]|uniref:LysR family transcriptional regulator n=1 Tax=Reyranella sp. TaxID=1929291 RepID=UPI001AC4C302|nr:LysR substrate-binding domain-containing protein [Reyranella sp.]MBN9090683.1 LysR family transcriptional regulator [Reyranella sp.]
MDVKLLEAFRAVVDSRSVTAAAQALGITQPAVSVQIAKLEESVGFPLFERAGGRLKPTPEGMLFYTEASRVLGEFDRLAATTVQIREGQSGRLVIASHPAAAISILPALVAAFVAERPGVSVRLVSRHSDVVSQLLPTEGYDLGIAELPVDETDVRLVRYQMRCVAILPPRHALASRKLLTPALLSGQPMVAPARSPQMLSRVYGTFAGADAQINAVVEAEFFASCCALVAAGTGWSLVDPLSAQSFSHLGLVTRPFEPAVMYEIGVFHRRDREPSVLAAAFLELLDAKLGSAR